MANSPDAASPQPFFRIREGWIATLSMLAAALALLGISRTSVIATSDQHILFPIAAALVALALPGPFLRVWDVPGQILLWNASGWCLALLVMGISSFGALTMLPVILLLFGLSSWPRAEGVPVLWLPAAITLGGGFIACVIVWEEIAFTIPFVR
jgi:hypothetical protein